MVPAAVIATLGASLGAFVHGNFGGDVHAPTTDGPAEVVRNAVADPGSPAFPSFDSPYPRRPPRPREMSKKARWLEEKASRPRLRVTQRQLQQAGRVRFVGRGPQATLPSSLPPPGSRIEPITTVFSLRLKEAVPVLPGRLMQEEFQQLLRDHYTNQSTDVDRALLGAVTRAALQFQAPRVDVVSGYRSPKYNLSLRKKGREVAETSQHCEGRAVDFRLRGVETRQLWKFVRSLRLGGVGFYPNSRFVHCDTGPVRFWNGN